MKEGGKLKIAVNAVGFAPGGGLTYLVNQAQHLLKLGSECHFSFFISGRCERQLRAAIPQGDVRNPFNERTPTLLRRLFWEQRQLPRLLERGRFDVLYCPANRGVFKSPIPQVVVDQNSWHHATTREVKLGWTLVRGRLDGAISRASFRSADAVVFLTQAYGNAMKEAGYRGHYCVVSSGAPADLPLGVSPKSVALCSVCESQGFVLAVHHWYPHKRVEWLVQNWSEISGSDSLHLVLVGSPVSGQIARLINRAMASSSIAARVHLLEDVSREHLAGLYQRARVYVSASALEALPLTPLEAMRFEVPCVLSDIPTHREVGGPKGYYFQRDSVAALAREIKRAIDRGAAEVDVEGQRYRWDDNARQMLSLLMSVAQKTEK